MPGFGGNSSGGRRRPVSAVIVVYSGAAAEDRCPAAPGETGSRGDSSKSHPISRIANTMSRGIRIQRQNGVALWKAMRKAGRIVQADGFLECHESYFGNDAECSAARSRTDYVKLRRERKTICQVFRTDNLPVIVCSGAAKIATAQAGIEIGICYFAKKGERRRAARA
jgi:hypothetical protein